MSRAMAVHLDGIACAHKRPNACDEQSPRRLRLCVRLCSPEIDGHIAIQGVSEQILPFLQMNTEG